MLSAAKTWLCEARGLPAFAAFVVAFMVLVIVEGAIVRATGSGNGCGQHWPLCNNQIIPHHPRLATIIEFTHRSLTGVCTALVATLIAWTFFATERGNPVRKTAVWTGILLITEGALGAVLVLCGYVERNASNARVFVQGVHFTNTMLLLAAMTATWTLLCKRSSVSKTLSGTAHWVWIALAATLLTGATGSIAALADTLFPSPSLSAGLRADFDPGAPLLIHMRWMHPAAALLALVAITMLALRSTPRWRNALLVALLAQFALGIADVVWLAPVTLQALHLFAADTLWIMLCATATRNAWPKSTGAMPETMSTRSFAAS